MCNSQLFESFEMRKKIIAVLIILIKIIQIILAQKGENQLISDQNFSNQEIDGESKDKESENQVTPRGLLRSVFRGVSRVARNGLRSATERFGVGHLLRSDQRVTEFGDEKKYEEIDGVQSLRRNEINQRQWEEHPAGTRRTFYAN